METQHTVSDWARSVGIAASPARHVSRANEEMAEALTAIIEGDRAKAAVEMADTAALGSKLTKTKVALARDESIRANFWQVGRKTA